VCVVLEEADEGVLVVFVHVRDDSLMRFRIFAGGVAHGEVGCLRLDICEIRELLFDALPPELCAWLNWKAP